MERWKILRESLFLETTSEKDIKAFIKKKQPRLSGLSVKEKDDIISADCMLFPNAFRADIIKKLKLKPDKPDIFPDFATSGKKVKSDTISLSLDEWEIIMKG